MPMRLITALLATIACGPGFVTSILAQGPAIAVLQYGLKPVPGPDGRTVDTLEVTAVISGWQPAPGSALLELAHVTFNVPSAARNLDVLEANDELGEWILQARDEGEGDAARRRWYAPRAPQGDIRVRYRVPAHAPLAPRGAAPPTELRNDAGAVSGSGAAFLLRPPAGEFVFRVSWDLSALPSGASAASSLGYEPAKALPAGALDRAYFMAGDLRRYPEPPAASGFFSAWQGEPPFDAQRLMATAEALRERFADFFGTALEAYGIFMRPNPVNPGGGIGLHRSFVVTFDATTDVTDLMFTLSHEMFHTFQPRLDDGGGANASLAQAWFNEGLAVFYQREFLFRAGLIDSESYLRDLNMHAARYYTSLLGNLPNSEIAAGFWRDTRIRTLPYDRGFLYFATVDEALRQASAGRRSLDDLVRGLRVLQDQRQTLVPADWEEAILRELGTPGLVAFREAMQGATPLPSASAFGPCFTRVRKDLQRYELGFEPAVLTESDRIVRGLIAGSAAERAGLRNGDRILKPVPQDAIQGDQQALLTLHVGRDGVEFDVSYRPRGETVPAWQWQRVPGRAESTCRESRAAG